MYLQIMKPLREVYIIILITSTLSVNPRNNADEGRSYEFGFTIDEEQHRYEKKDQNGIVKGEFGFITADGVYHVTVYATDENGDFKILSIRNIRISAAPDMSTVLSLSSLEEIKTGKQTTKHSRNEYSKVDFPKYLLRQTSTAPFLQPLQVITQTPGSYIFTTSPTIKPACGGCGYVTTPQKEHQLNFQNPAFKALGPDSGQGFVLTGRDRPQGQEPILTNLSPPETQTKQVLQNYEKYMSPSGSEHLPPGINYQSIGEPQTIKVDEYQQNSLSRGRKGKSFVARNDERNLIQSQKMTSKLPTVSVSENIIHIGGNKPMDIPIRDKYPNMVDGLPNGIDETNIKSILYKFHYTTGFHGHYEKGLMNGSKIGGYFVNGRDGISRVITYIADENGYRPKFRFINLGLDSPDTPKEATEKKYGLKSFEFVWYLIE